MAETSIYVALGQSFWYVWLGLFLVCIPIILYLFDFWTGMKKYAEESVTEMECSRPLKKKVVGRLIDGAGHEVSFKCIASEENPALLDTDTLLISPNKVSAKKFTRKKTGAPVLNYAMPCILPMTYHEAAAITQLIKHVRENHKELDWIMNDPELIARIFTPDVYLKEDCIRTVKDNSLELADNKKDIEEKATKMYNSIKRIREEMKITRLQAAPVSLAEASELCNVGITNSEVQEILTDQRRLDMLSIVDDFFGRYKSHLVVLAVCVTVMVVAFLVVTQVK